MKKMYNKKRSLAIAKKSDRTYIMLLCTTNGIAAERNCRLITVQ